MSKKGEARPGRTSPHELRFFYQEAQKCLFVALQSLNLAKANSDPHVQMALIRDAAVNYAKPFSGSNGVVGDRKHYLPERFIPRELRATHKVVMAERDQRFAHLDLEKRVPKDTPIGPYLGIALAGFYYREHYLPLMKTIEQLVLAVEENLEVETEALLKLENAGS